MMFLLQLRNELWKLFGKRRTYLGSAMFLLAQTTIVLLFKYSSGPYREMIKQLQRFGFPVEQYVTNLTIATTTMVATAYLLLPLYVALVGGDLMAKETEDGTLRMILSRPVTRLRLILLKWCAGSVFSILLVASTAIYGLLFARLFFPGGGLFVFFPIDQVTGVFNGSEAWWRYGLAQAGLALKGITIMTLAFMFSCFNVKPAAATIMAISLIFISFILQQMPYFDNLQPWFLTYHINFWSSLFIKPLPWWKIGSSLSMLFGYLATFLAIGGAVFHVRDIKS